MWVKRSLILHGPDSAEPDDVRLTCRRIVTSTVSSINVQDYPQFPDVYNIPAELIEHDSDRRSHDQRI